MKKTSQVVELGKAMEIKGDKIIIDLKQVQKGLRWKMYFDKTTEKPCGQQFYVAVAGLDEELPTYVNKPQWVEEREAIVLILNQGKIKKSE